MMAKTVITTDDIDGSPNAEPVEFSYDGVRYTIDLGKRNRAAFEKAIKPWINAAAKVSSGRPRRATAAGKSRRRPGKTGPKLADVRAWAAAQGIEVSERGRVAQHVVDAYTAAQ